MRQRRFRTQTILCRTSASFFCLLFIFGFSRCSSALILLLPSTSSSIMSSFSGSSRPILRRSSARLSASRSAATPAMRSVRKGVDPIGTPSPATKRPRHYYLTSSTATRQSDLTPAGTVPSAAAIVTPATTASVVGSSSAAFSGTSSSDQLERDGFVDLGVPPCELRPSATLTTGQCFHWRAIAAASQDAAATSKGAAASSSKKKRSAWGSHNATEWIGTLRVPVTGESLVVVLRETPQSVWYKTLYEPPPSATEAWDARAFLYSYFQLPGGMENDSREESSSSSSLRDLYEEWSMQCGRLKRIAACIPGVRIVDQDPWECLVSFLCSSNNNIPRITQMLNALRRAYGEPLCTVTPDCLGAGRALVDTADDEAAASSSIVLYSFPSLEKLKACATESDLRNKCGMGYRAKYLMETMKTLDSLGGENYLQELRSISDPIVVQEKLIQFQGVGRKVADCVALFSLRQCDAIPVDVHVWDIARRDYGADDAIVQTAKSLTPTIYKQIGDLFRTRFPNNSGWAHSLLFVAELPSFRPALPDDIVEEMQQFRLEQKAKKKGK